MEANLSYFHFICTIASFLTISMSLILVFVKSKENRANLYLGLLLFFYSLFFIPGLLDSIELLDDFPHFVRLNFLSGASVGPLTLLYCKSSIHRNPLNIREKIAHGVPFVLAFLYHIPTLLKSGQEKMEIYHTTIYMGEIPENHYVVLALTTLTILYTIFSIFSVQKYLFRKSKQYSKK